MTEYFLFLILGMSIGAVYAALTLGIVVTYQGAGVINFAAAAMAIVPLFVFDDMTKAKLTLPIPWVPSLEFDQPPPTWICLVVALIVAAAIGALVELCVSRPLRNAPVLAKVVGAIGVMMTLQAAVGLKYGTDARTRMPILPTGSVQIGEVSVPRDRLWLIGVVVVAGIVLAVWSSRSRAGLAIQAAAENERAAAFARLSTYSLGMLTWVLASVFTSLVLILAGPATGVLTPDTLSLLVVPALAAALIARLRSIWWGLFGALGLGVVQAELQYLSNTKDWWPDFARQGISDAVPFLVIVVVLFVFGRSIPTRGDEVLSSLPTVILPRNRPVAIAIAVAALFALMAALSGTYRFGLITSLSMALIALSLVVLTGMVGQISLAQAAFAGTAGLFLSKIGTDLPFPFSMIAAALLAAVVGVVVGLPALRIRGAQLAVVTLAAALTVEKFILSNPSIASSTANVIPSPSFLGIDLAVQEGTDIARLPFGVMVLTVVTIAFVLVGNVMRSGSGRKMLAVRSNERAASSIGISVAGVKLTAFALASFLAGLGGTLIGYSRGQLSPTSFGVFVGVSLLAIAYLCGITSVSGATLAGAGAVLGILFVFFDEHLALGSYYTLLTGLSLILTVVLNPEGIVGKMRSDAGRVMAWARRGRTSAETVEVVAAPVAAGAPRKPREIGDVVLEAKGITVQYGGLRAVDDVSVNVRAGEIVGLIGANGAGKTSFIDAVTGFTPATGLVSLEGRDMARRSPHSRVRGGLVRTWQAGELFDDLSVLSNVQVADDIGQDTWKFMRDFVRPTRPISAEVDDAIALMGLGDVVDRKPSELPLGRQKALGVARAVALRPTALLLDEPAAGLDTAESQHFGGQLRDIASTGIGCLLIDHDMHLVMGVCDRVYVVEFGKLIAQGTPDEVRNDPRVIASYLGSTDGAGATESSAASAELDAGDRPVTEGALP